MNAHLEIWLIIVGLGLGTYLLRLSFLGFVGDRPIPEWILRHLRYVATAVLPALIAPLILWPSATNGDTDPSRLIAAAAAFGVGWYYKSVVGAVFAGMAGLYGAQYLLG